MMTTSGPLCRASRLLSGVESTVMALEAQGSEAWGCIVGQQSAQTAALGNLSSDTWKY